jgi:hypothetical protein
MSEQMDFRKQSNLLTYGIGYHRSQALVLFWNTRIAVGRLGPAISDLALIILAATDESFAQEGISPHRISGSSRTGSFGFWPITGTEWVGARAKIAFPELYPHAWNS